MAPYHYFPSKDAILDGVFQAVLGELPPLPKRGNWQRLVTRRAHQFREVLMKHPRASGLFATRPAVSAASIERVEEMLAVLREAGTSVRESLCLFQCMVAFVVGHTMNSVAEATPPDYAKLDRHAFRHVHEVVELSSYDLEAEFSAGVRAMLRGLGSSCEASIGWAPRLTPDTPSPIGAQAGRSSQGAVLSGIGGAPLEVALLPCREDDDEGAAAHGAGRGEWNETLPSCLRSIPGRVDSPHPRQSTTMLASSLFRTQRSSEAPHRHGLSRPEGALWRRIETPSILLT